MRNKENIVSIVRDCREWRNQMSFTSGWGNGYVGVPKDHHWYGKDYMEIECEVHGGLTYGNFGKDLKTKSPMSKYPDLYFVGFDTAHLGDNLENCSEKYVINQTENLKQQAIMAYQNQIQEANK